MTCVARFEVRRLADHEVLPALAEVARRDRATTAELLVLIGRADADRLYAPTGHDSMFRYCMAELRMSEDIAYKRIRVARLARKLPVILAMIADGRLHLSGAYLLAPHLRRDNVRELLQAATHRSKFEIEKLLAERFPKSAMPAFVAPAAPAPATVTPSPCQLAPGPVAIVTTDATPLPMPPSAPAPAPQLAPGPVANPTPIARIIPLGPDCTGIQFALTDEALEKLRYAEALLSHAVPTGDLAQVFGRALDALIEKQEKRKFAVTSRTRAGKGDPSSDPRYIPNSVRREVLVRDEGRCTFESASGERCGSRRRLQFHHIITVADGGEPTPKNLRLHCQTHNQLAAERDFGKEFMARKRAESRRKREAKANAARAAEAERARQEAYARELAANEHARQRAEEIMPWLRKPAPPASEAMPTP